MYDLAKKMDEYSDELFLDLGLITSPEEQKADIYARLQDHLHSVVLASFKKVLNRKEMTKLRTALEQEDYRRLNEILKLHPKQQAELEQKIQSEYDRLKLIISKEQKKLGSG